MKEPACLLVLFAHPVLHKSCVQRVLAEAARGVDGVTVHDLYEAYPTGFVDVAHEQEILRAHDVIVFQHPFYWYSSSAILKEWQDLVLEHGFAYGDGGTALAGKTMLNALSAGGPEAAYGRGGYNHFTVRELLAPFEQTARLCGMGLPAPLRRPRRPWARGHGNPGRGRRLRPPARHPAGRHPGPGRGARVVPSQPTSRESDRRTLTWTPNTSSPRP